MSCKCCVECRRANCDIKNALRVRVRWRCRHPYVIHKIVLHKIYLPCTCTGDTLTSEAKPILCVARPRSLVWHASREYSLLGQICIYLSQHSHATLVAYALAAVCMKYYISCTRADVLYTVVTFRARQGHCARGGPRCCGSHVTSRSLHMRSSHVPIACRAREARGNVSFRKYEYKDKVYLLRRVAAELSQNCNQHT